MQQKYAERANNRDGGVGTETQIISKEVYTNSEQEKFVAATLEKMKQDSLICQPIIILGFI